jgi:hypothetical protein
VKITSLAYNSYPNRNSFLRCWMVLKIEDEKVRMTGNKI